MAKAGQQLVQFRTFGGLNLNTDSRVVDPTAWKKLKNLYQKIQGRLRKRPGSQTTHFGDSAVSTDWFFDWRSPPSEEFALPGLGSAMNSAGFDSKFFHMAQGEEGLTSLVENIMSSDGSTADNFAGNIRKDGVVRDGISLGPMSSISSLPVHGRPKDVVVGACTINGKDRLFYLRNQSPNDSQIGYHIMEHGKDNFWGAGRDWFFIPSIVPGADWLKDGERGMFAGSGRGAFNGGGISNPYNPWSQIGTNTPIKDGTQVFHKKTNDGAIVGYATDQLGHLMCIYDASKTFTRWGSDDLNLNPGNLGLSSANLTGAVELKCQPFRCAIGGGGEETSDAEMFNTGRNLRKTNYGSFTEVRSLIDFQGSLVLGGYRRVRQYDYNIFDASFQGEDEDGHGPHMVAFSEARNPHMFHRDAVIRVGANKQEPITAMGKVSSPSDNDGLTAGLAIFTSRKVVLYTGLPPQGAVLENTGEAGGPTADATDFIASMNFNVGTISPRTVVETPMGLVFLGTDGVVYVISGSDKPMAIGRAIQPVLRQLNNTSLSRASAFYDKGFYKLCVPDFPQGELENQISSDVDHGGDYSAYVGPSLTDNSSAGLDKLVNITQITKNAILATFMPRTPNFFTTTAFGNLAQSPQIGASSLLNSQHTTLEMAPGTPPVFTTFEDAKQLFDQILYLDFVDTQQEFRVFGSPTKPGKQYWADVRSPEGGAYDIGVKWSGAHEGQSLSDTTEVKGSNDRREIYAIDNFTSSGEFATDIVQVSIETLTTDYTKEAIHCRGESPDVDLQDAHVDKLYQGLELGVETNKPTNITTTVSALAPGGCVAISDESTQPVDPCGNKWGAILGEGTYAGQGDFELYCSAQSKRMQGRMFQVAIEEKSDAAIALSDLTLKIVAKGRRQNLTK